MSEISEQTEIEPVPSEEEVRRFFQSNEPLDQLATIGRYSHFTDGNPPHSTINYSAYPNIKPRRRV